MQDEYSNKSGLSDSNSKRRKAGEMIDDGYDDINKQLRELYQERQRMKGQEKMKLSEPKDSHRIEFEKEDKRQDPFQKENFEPIEEIKIEDSPKGQTSEIHFPIGDPVSPTLWLNKLRYYPQDFMKENMISFRELMYEDLLRKDQKNPKRTLEFAFMTTFGYDMELIGPVVKGGVKLVLADEWDSISEPRIQKNVQGYPNFTQIRSPKDPARNFTGAFHPKIWLLKFPTFLRVVVGSGNLTAGDWIIWSNCLWFKDFPKKSTLPKKPETEKNPDFDFDQDFEMTLKDYIQSLMPNRARYTDLLDVNIDDYYITGVDIVLIPSIPGRHKEDFFDSYGHRRVASIINKLYPRVAPEKKKKYVLTYQSSTIGALDEKFLKELLSSFLPGYMTIEDLKADKKLTKKKSDQKLLFSSEEPVTKRMRMIFPPKDYVENCIEGPEHSGCLILSPDAYQKDTFPKDIFYQFQAPEDYAFHEGIIPHLKVFIVSEESGEIGDDTIIYFGSHNCSPSAWGRYEKEYTQLSISNSELGVLLPPLKGSKEKKEAIIKSLSFKFPPKKYEKGQVPWMFRIHFNA